MCGLTEVVLQKYDLVFAIGKCALESLASGCAVITLTPELVGELVTSDNFDSLAFSNFCPRRFESSAQINKKWLQKELARYSASDAAQVTHLVRTTRNLEVSVEKICALHQTVLEEGPLYQDAPFAPYLESLACDIDALWAKAESLNDPLWVNICHHLLGRRK